MHHYLKRGRGGREATGEWKGGEGGGNGGPGRGRAAGVRGAAAWRGRRRAWWWLGAALLKALVWFWLIDETLSVNLVYQDDYEIGSTTPSDEQW